MNHSFGPWTTGIGCGLMLRTSWKRRLMMLAATSFHPPQRTGWGLAILLIGGLLAGTVPTVRFTSAGEPVKPPQSSGNDAGRPEDEPPPKAATASTSPARKPPPDFFVLPITTELQRALLGPRGQDAGVFVVVNEAALLKNPTVAAETGERVAKQAERIDTKADASLYVMYFVGGPASQPDKAIRKSTRQFFEGAIQQAGVEELKTTGLAVNDGRGWPDMIRPLQNPESAKTGVEEPRNGADEVSVYSVGTMLSRFLTSDADCVVVIDSPAGTNRPIPAVEESIVQAVAQLDLKRKTRITFRVPHGQDSERGETLAAWDKLAKTLGFQGSSVTFR